MENIEDTILVIKWVYPIISFCFFSIVTLLIYIWKTNTSRTDKILEETNKTLAKLVTLTAVHDARLNAVEKDLAA